MYLETLIFKFDCKCIFLYFYSSLWGFIYLILFYYLFLFIKSLPLNQKNFSLLLSIFYNTGGYLIRSHRRRICSNYLKILKDVRNCVKSCDIIRVPTVTLNLGTLTEWALDSILLETAFILLEYEHHSIRKNFQYYIKQTGNWENSLETASSQESFTWKLHIYRFKITKFWYQYLVLLGLYFFHIAIF